MSGKSNKKCSIKTPGDIANMDIFLFHHDDVVVAIPAQSMGDCKVCIENGSIINSLKRCL